MLRTLRLAKPADSKRSRRILTRSAAVGAVAVVAATMAGAPAGAATDDTAAQTTTPTVLAWFETTTSAVGSSQREWAIAWGAAADAIDAAPSTLSPDDEAVYAQAALAGAVHDALIGLYPELRDVVAPQRTKTLDALPDGAAETAGLRAGESAAAAAVAEREGDGWDEESSNPPFPTPTPGPGVWQPAPPRLTPGFYSKLGEAEPLLIDDVADRLVAPEPPALDSAEMVRDLKEIADVGSKDSTTRTPEQLAVASFWRGSEADAYNQALQDAVATSTRPIGDLVRRVTVFNQILADTVIAIYASKYEYLRWRPVTALRTDDGNPRTPYDPEFLPTFTGTVPTPEYPSGHVTSAASAEVVMTVLFGPKPKEPIGITLEEETRTYSAWSEITRENVDARVWAGYHFRGTDNRSVAFGRQIAVTGLREAASELLR
ncbi:MAG: vanadium-dependent haloperoxidase [Dermatophilaceae bacterium]